jgi:hypothetical protein
MFNKLGFHCLQLIKEYSISTPTIATPYSNITLIATTIQAVSASTYPLTNAGAHISTSWRIMDGTTVVWQDLNDTTHLTSVTVSITSSFTSDLYLQVQYNGQLASSSWSPSLHINLEYCTPSTPTLSTAVYSCPSSIGAWSSWMNAYSVFFSNSSTNTFPNSYVSVQEPLSITAAGNYIFQYLADNQMRLLINGLKVVDYTTDVPGYGPTAENSFSFISPLQFTIYLAVGIYNLNITLYNGPGSSSWSINPTGISLLVNNTSGSNVFNLLYFVGNTSMYCPGGGVYSTLDGMCHCYTP